MPADRSTDDLTIRPLAPDTWRAFADLVERHNAADSAQCALARHHGVLLLDFQADVYSTGGLTSPRLCDVNCS